MVCSNYCPLTSPIKVDFHITVHAPPQLLPHQRRQRVTGPAALAVTILEESRLLRNQTNLTNQRKKRDQEGKSQKRTRVKLLSPRWKPHSHPLDHLCHWGDPRSGSWSDQGPLHRALAGWSKRTLSHSCPPPSALVSPPSLSSPIVTFILYILQDGSSWVSRLTVTCTSASTVQSLLDSEYTTTTYWYMWLLDVDWVSFPNQQKTWEWDYSSDILNSRTCSYVHTCRNAFRSEPPVFS